MAAGAVVVVAEAEAVVVEEVVVVEEAGDEVALVSLIPATPIGSTLTMNGGASLMRSFARSLTHEVTSARLLQLAPKKKSLSKRKGLETASLDLARRREETETLLGKPQLA